MFVSKILQEIASQPFKRSQTGLFQGKMKQYGNNVPFSKHKTRRTWLPNVQHKRLPSEIIGGNIRVKLTTSALRTIKKKGGLDNYLKTTSAELLGDAGMRLRLRMREEELKQSGKTPKQYEILTAEQEKARRENALFSPVSTNTAFETPRTMRVLAAEALGRPGELASAAETIIFLKERAEARRAAKPIKLGPSTPSEHSKAASL